MAVGTLINTISRLLGLPTFPKKELISSNILTQDLDQQCL